jgi:hypothetical protein
MSDKKKAAPTTTTKPAAAPAAAELKKEKELEKVYVTSSELAAQLKTKGTILRRWLRTLPAFQDNGYTRYKWDPSDSKDAQFLKDAAFSFEKYQKSSDEKKTAREAELKEKAEAKKVAKETAKATKKPAKEKAEKAEDDETEGDEEEMFEDETEGEELE